MVLGLWRRQWENQFRVIFNYIGSSRLAYALETLLQGKEKEEERRRRREIEEEEEEDEEEEEEEELAKVNEK